MTDYHSHVALIVPLAQQDPANQAAAALTGRPPDLATFKDEPGRRLTDDTGGVYLIAGPTPMKDEHVAALPLLASQFGVDAEWKTIAIWDGGRVPMTTVEAWAEGLGLVREAVPDEPEPVIDDGGLEPDTGELEPDTGELINVNTADSGELQKLEGVGPSLAQKIIDDRPYDTVDDLTRVSGVSEGMVDGWRDEITV